MSGRDPSHEDVMRSEKMKDRRANERQADALAALAEHVEIQNAVLLELVTELKALRRAEQGEDPHDFSHRGTAKNVENRALELYEQVDLDAVRRVSNDE